MVPAGSEKKKRVTLAKWPGKTNPADLYTKHLSRVELLAHMSRMNYKVVEGRSSIAPVRPGTIPCVHPYEFDSEAPIDAMEVEPVVSSDMAEKPMRLCISSLINQVSDHVSFSPEGHGGLGGCRNPTHDDFPALAWCDMIVPS